jgi:glutaredoxin
MTNLGVEYELKDVEHNPKFAVEAEQIAGRKNIPVVQFADGKFLVEPSDAELHAELTVRGLI